jgi:magnesium transporter
MSTTMTDLAPWHALGELADRGDAEELLEGTTILGSRECARAMTRLDGERCNKILTTLDPEHAADLMEEMPEAQAAKMIGNLQPKAAAAILNEMESAETADLLGMLDDDFVEELLKEMEPEAARDARMLSQFDDNVAGGLMITEYLAFPDTLNVRQVIDDMRVNSELYREYSIQYTYVTAPDGLLIGVLPLRSLLLTPGDIAVRDIMIKNPLSVEADDSLEELTRLFEDYDFLGVPVVDDDGRLLGVVRRTDVVEAVGDKAQSDFLKAQGIVGGEELRSMPLYQRCKGRLSWLSANIFLNIFSASVISFYEGTLQKAIALAVFLPIISDMSGCSGNQAVAVSMRELTLGLIKPRDLVHVWMKEISVGVINGLALGCLMGVVGMLWKGNPTLGLVVGTALALNTVLAVVLGSALPLIMKAFKADPALASGPILTTCTDMCGFFFVLSFASFAIDRLV